MAASERGFHVVGDEMVQHEDVGLLDQLRAPDPVDAEQYVGGDWRWCDCCGQQRFEIPVAIELLIEAPIRIPPVDEAVGQAAPAGRLDRVGAALHELRTPT